jgi:lipoprotein-releasing system permease protein
MYKLLLILKYLRKRRIAWVSLIAVTLCTAMVLVVISIMGGWLHMFLDTNHAVGGDIVVYKYHGNGFGGYKEMLDAIRKLPQVKAAVPVIRSFGVVDFGLNHQMQAAVQVMAYGDLDQVGQVNSFQKSLWRQYQQPMKLIDEDKTLSSEEKEKRKATIAAKPPSFDKPLDAEVYREYLPQSAPGFDPATLPGMICGTQLIMQKKTDGSYDRGDWLFNIPVKLHVADLSTLSDSAPSVPASTYWLIDDCRTGLYFVDSNTVYVPFDKLQRDLGMAEKPYQEVIAGQTVDRSEPARISEIQIALNDERDSDAAIKAIQAVVDSISPRFLPFASEPLRVEGWEEHQAQYTSAITHEKVLLTFLFGVISIVAVFLVFCIFYMIVVEKTRDIGIIKSVGATNGGVAQIFLGYGLLIGLLGAGMGLLSAYLVIHNINEIHAWLGRAMGIKIWDPQTYIFDTIPNTMDAHDVFWICSIAVLSALAGAMVPALRASRMNPVEALRWE